MTPWAVVDTGPLVAFLDRREEHHKWAKSRFKEFSAPLLVCEPVLTEAAHLLRSVSGSRDAIVTLVRQGAVKINFSLDTEWEAVAKLLHKYRDQPMSLADACVVRMAELNASHAVMTLDSDFASYRKNGRESLTLVMPSESK